MPWTSEFSLGGRLELRRPRWSQKETREPERDGRTRLLGRLVLGLRSFVTSLGGITFSVLPRLGPHVWFGCMSSVLVHCGHATHLQEEFIS